jgi:hypothetical protein
MEFGSSKDQSLLTTANFNGLWWQKVFAQRNDSEWPGTRKATDGVLTLYQSPIQASTRIRFHNPSSSPAC